MAFVDRYPDATRIVKASFIVPRRLRHGPGLPRQQRLIDGRRPRRHHAIHRNALPLPHPIARC